MSEAFEIGSPSVWPSGADGPAGERPAPCEAIELRLVVRDPELLDALSAHPAGRDRDGFAATALRIGVLALRQAEGRLDGDVVRREGERLLAELARHLTEHRQVVGQHLAESLREYFDPESGRFNERVERLVRRDGELEELLRRQVGSDDSTLGRTLAAHLGDDSPLLRLLHPDESEGLVAALERRVGESLDVQRERILAQFSLDDRESALSRLVQELAERHGALGRGLEEKLGEVVAEFSLDDEDSALSRLVGRVERAQRQISSEFSLDQEGSALARMKGELLGVLESHREGAARFQEEVRAALAAMQARREEAARSTRHGDDFEAAVVDFVQAAAQRAGDMATRTGQTPGRIRHCKKGDAVVELGPESAAPGARIVIEAKEDQRFDLARARRECDEARRNRAAPVAVFVFSRRTAPAGLSPFARYGDDVVVVWDPDDPAGDVFLEAGLSVARALCTRAASHREERRADLDGLDRAVREIERQARGLDEIRTAAETIRGGSERILDRARIVKRGLARQVALLDEGLEGLRDPTERAGDG